MKIEKKIRDDGSIYEGELLDSKRSGQGFSIHPNGVKYNGQW